MGKWIYYMRVSTKQQKLDRQQKNIELDQFCKRMNLSNEEIIILSDKESGKDFDRPQYKLLKQVVGAGDSVIVSSIDRFGRNYIEGRKEFTELISKGVKVYPLDRPMIEKLYGLDDSMSRFMLNFLVDWELMNAEEELKRIKKRQKEGIHAAKLKNKKFGRPAIQIPDNFNEVYSEWKYGKLTAKAAMTKLGLKRNTFYKFANSMENRKKE